LRQESIQSLRGIAAILVVLVHSINYLTVRGVLFPEWVHQYKFIGDIGVDVFFIISGYVMMVALEKKPTAFIFLKQRFIRIWPLYIFYTVLLLLSHILLKFDGINWVEFIRSLFFIPTLKSDYEFLPFLGPGWTLGFEMIFYSVVSISLFFNKNIKACIYLSIFLITIVGLLFPYGYFQYFTNSIVLEFLFGVSIYYAIKYEVIRHHFLVCILILLSLFFFSEINSQLDPGRFYKYGFFSALLFTLFVVFKVNIFLLNIVGNISYTLYLMHLSIGFQSYWLLVKLLGVGVSIGVWHILTLMIFLVIISFFLYEYIEKKLMVFISDRF
jgi:exopolysaccharide production protein ExoZ